MCVNAVHHFDMVVALEMWIRSVFVRFLLLLLLAKGGYWNTASESLRSEPDVITMTSSESKIDTEFEGLLVCFMTNCVQIWMSFVYFLFFFDKSLFYQDVLCSLKTTFLKKIILWSCELCVSVTFYTFSNICICPIHRQSIDSHLILWWPACFTAVHLCQFSF